MNDEKEAVLKKLDDYIKILSENTAALTVVGEKSRQQILVKRDGVDFPLGEVEKKDQLLFLLQQIQTQLNYPQANENYILRLCDKLKISYKASKPLTDLADQITELFLV